MNQVNYHLLISKMVTGEISQEELKLLQDWLQQSPEHQSIFKNLQQFWDQAKLPEALFLPEVQEEWSVLETALGLTRTHKRRTWHETLVHKLHLLLHGKKNSVRLAISFACILFIGLILWKTEIVFSKYHVVVTKNAERKEIVLSDGSRIRMNCGSTVKYIKAWKNRRQVQLTGEAFFTVQPAEIPFIVKTKNAETRVLGTEFNVWARDKQTRVIVKKGRVQLTSIKNDSGEVVLNQGMMSRIQENRLPETPEMTDVEKSLGWLENRLVFDGEPLKQVIAEVIRFYDTDIQIADPSLSELTMTASFSDMTLEEVLESICLAINARYFYKKDCYYIVR